jgi:hypothetical protein
VHTLQFLKLGKKSPSNKVIDLIHAHKVPKGINKTKSWRNVKRAQHPPNLQVWMFSLCIAFNQMLPNILKTMALV